MSDLKPCPFCGGEANTLYRPHVIDCRYSVGCNDDECRGFIGLSWLYKTEAEAVEAWNSRAERTCEWELEHSGTLYDKWRCSKCGYLFVEPRCDPNYTDMVPNYCPNCGAKVVGE